MSQSPATADEANANDNYLQGWRDLNKMLRRGGSLSGRERNCAFLNLGNEPAGPQFACVSGASGFDFVDDGRAMALVDWDHDGDLDIWASNRTGPRLRLIENNSGRDNHFVAFRLQGTDVNRDAIGARVELTIDGGTDEPQRQFVQSVVAGDSYLTQSSRWLHFGLGQAEKIASVRVIWPGKPARGRTYVQEFADIKVDRRYRLVQGQATPELQGRVPVSLSSLSEPAPNPIELLPNHVLVSRRFPFPPMKVTSADGSTQLLFAKPGRPLLVNFWASWCAPCLQELRVWSRRQEELKAAGLDVFALSALDPEKPNAATLAKAAVERLEFPFRWGFVNAEDVTLADTVLSAITPEYQRPFGVPVSILLDRHGQTAAIYRGAIDLDVVLRDAALIDSTPGESRAFASPFGGRWLHAPLRASVLDYATSLKEAKLELTPQHYLSYVLALADRDVTGPYAITDRMKGEAAFALGSELLTKQQWDEAVKYSLRASELLPRDYRAYANLGTAYLQVRRPQDALNSLSKALSLNPDSFSILLKRGNAFSQLQRFEEAIADWQSAAEIKPADEQIHGKIAAVAFGLGDDVRAAEHYRELIGLDPNSLDYKAALAWILATSRDDKVRDGAEAVRLARTWVDEAASNDPKPLNALAAALAQIGQFDEAVSVMQQAISYAKSQQNTVVVKAYQKRLELYQKRKPYLRP